MQGDKKQAFEAFQLGHRRLFAIVRCGIAYENATLNDIVFQKVDNGHIAIMFWEEASDAEGFVVRNGQVSIFEPREISISELVDIVERILGPNGSNDFRYMLY